MVQLVVTVLGVCGLVAWVTGRRSRPRRHDWLAADLLLASAEPPAAAPLVTRLFGDDVVYADAAAGVTAGGRSVELFDFAVAPGEALLTGASVALQSPWPDLHVEGDEESLLVACGFPATAEAWTHGPMTLWSPDRPAVEERLDAEIVELLADLSEAVSITITGDRLLLWSPALPPFVLAALPAILERCLRVLEGPVRTAREPVGPTRR